MAIVSFSDKGTELFFTEGELRKTVGWGGIKNIVKRKLDMLHFASQLGDLRAPPGNQLERLRGQLAGFHSIRVNDQWRIVFKWGTFGPEQVQVCDYH